MLLATTTGCGSTLYLAQVRQAERRFGEASELGAEKLAPYEYYSAKTRIAEARHQAAHAQYGVAVRLSKEARQFSEQAIAGSKKARDTAPSPPNVEPVSPSALPRAPVSVPPSTGTDR